MNIRAPRAERRGHEPGRIAERLGRIVDRLHDASLDRRLRAPGVDPGRVVAHATPRVGPARTRTVLPGAPEIDRPRTDRVVVVAIADICATARAGTRGR